MFHTMTQLSAEAATVAGIDLKVVAAAFAVGVVVGITGMGGGALMTPALIFLGVGDAATVVTADLTAAAVYKSGGAIVHWREGSPHLRLACWLIVGSVPMALLGPFAVSWVVDPADIDDALKMAIGFALLFAASTYALRLFIQLRRLRDGTRMEGEPVVRPVPTILVGALGGLLVGITSVGSGSVIMIALLMLYPTLSAVKLVGTDLVQAVPLVFAAAMANIAVNGLDWGLLFPLIIGSLPGTIIGSKIAPRVPQSVIRRAIVVVLTMSGVALLDKSGWAPLGAGEDETHPLMIGLVGVATLVLLPLVWGLLRRTEGLPMFGNPTVAELEALPPPRRSARAQRRASRDAQPVVDTVGEPGGYPVPDRDVDRDVDREPPRR
ncbi:MAG: sulfite exporter TauE/SafE family protein [Actinomycetota bacterium]|nr:sulfite exporter TauE/SafE family protein [Actinomycetota bacterium]